MLINAKQTMKKPFKNKEIKPKAEASQQIRLNRVLSNSGLCSRREADQHIAMGLVMVNGKVVTTLGIKVSPTDEVKFDGQTITRAKMTYVLLNKPKGFVALSKKADKTKKTTQQLLQTAFNYELPPLGEMGRTAMGLLILTNDNTLRTKLLDNAKLNMVYHIKLDAPILPSSLEKLKKGVVVQQKRYALKKISYLEGVIKTEVGVEVMGIGPSLLHKIFLQLKLNILYLDRVSLGGLNKKDLPRGRWRHLSPKEISFLQMF